MITMTTHRLPANLVQTTKEFDTHETLKVVSSITEGQVDILMVSSKLEKGLITLPPTVLEKITTEIYTLVSV
jgi:hypothetical protein